MDIKNIETLYQIVPGVCLPSVGSSGDISCHIDAANTVKNKKPNPSGKFKPKTRKAIAAAPTPRATFLVFSQGLNNDLLIVFTFLYLRNSPPQTPFLMSLS